MPSPCFRTRKAGTMRARFEAEGDVIVVTGGANGIRPALARAAAAVSPPVRVCRARAQASAYAASKAALVAFVKSAAKEVAQYRVRFNLIAPGVIDPPQYRQANAGADDARWRASVGVGQPEDAVGALMFLLSDQATMT